MIATTLGRDRELTEQAVAELPQPVEIVELDATRPEDFDSLAEHLRSRWGGSTARCTPSRSRPGTRWPAASSRPGRRA